LTWRPTLEALVQLVLLHRASRKPESWPLRPPRFGTTPCFDATLFDKSSNAQEKVHDRYIGTPEFSNGE
jgi:hypothetical protein